MRSLEEIFKTLVSWEAGCVVLFVGVVRGVSKGKRVKSLILEGVDEALLQRIADEARENFNLLGALIEHTKKRKLGVGERILVAAVAAMSREEAFSALQWMIERVKREAHVGLREELE